MTFCEFEIFDTTPKSGGPSSGGAVQDGHQAVRVKDGFVLEHKIGGASRLDGDHGVGFELVAAELGFQSLGQGTNDGVVAFGNDGGSAESPAPLVVAQLGAAEAFGFGGASHGAFDQAAIGQKFFSVGKRLMSPTS